METPPFRILQRPCQTAVKDSSESVKPTATVKSLEQREIDYAAARRRIMGSDAPESEEKETEPASAISKATTGTEFSLGNSARHGIAVTNTNSVTATPLMSIQATPNVIGGFKPDFQFTIGTTSSFTASGGGQPQHSSYTACQGSTMNCVPKHQQQFRSVMGGTRTIHPQQPHRILAPSNSSPALFMPSRSVQHLPAFPANVNNLPNAGILPTPPGFSYPLPTTTLNDNGIGMHHSHTASASLMQHFGLIQQHYQQPVNGFQHLVSPFSQANNSVNPMNFGISPLFNANQKHTHQPTFN